MLPPWAAGAILMNSLAEINELRASDSRESSVHLVADGVASSLQLDSLRSFIDASGTSSSGNGRWSTVDAYRGGTVEIEGLEIARGLDIRGDHVATPELSSLYQGRLHFSGVGEFTYPKLGEAPNATLSATGPDLYLPSLRTATGSTIFADNGSLISAPLLQTVDASHLRAYDGATVSLPQVTHYDAKSTGNDQTRIIRAEGPGSLIDLSGLTSIINGTHYNSHIRIDAFAGGDIDLSSVQEIRDVNAGDTRRRSIDIQADGTDTLINLKSLVNFIDVSGTGPGAINARWSTLTSLNEGVIWADALAETSGVHVELGGGSSSQSDSQSAADSGEGQEDDTKGQAQPPAVTVQDASLAPQWTSGNVADGEVSFNLSQIVLEFDKALKPTSVVPSSVELFAVGEDGAVGTSDDTLVAIESLIVADERLIVRPAQPLGSAQFHLRVDGVAIEDSDGNVAGEDLALTFRSRS